MEDQRIQLIRDKFDENEIDAFFIKGSHNIFYVSGFTGTSGYVIVGRDKSILITDSRYTEQAENECKGFEIVDIGKNFFGTVCNALEAMRAKKVGFEDAQVTYKLYTELIKNCEDIEWIPIDNAIEQIRMIKNENEIELVRKACNIADNAFSHIIKYIKPGIKEKDIALELEFFMKKAGASNLSFDTIVASGKRSSMPHGKASEKLIEHGDCVTMDFGCVFENYCSDMTRTVFVGEADEELAKIYNIVLDAQSEVLKKIGPGVTCMEADRWARDIISNSGYGKNFGHGLGHSLGLEVHENPSLSPKAQINLETGMLVTVEPGIYVEGLGGVRIEDMVLITRNGSENFIKSTKKLLIL